MRVMRINCFEEYPSEETLRKARMLPPGMIFIAGRSLAEFYAYRAMLAAYAPHMEAAYWPILQDECGNGSYWPSVFSHPRELLSLKRELLSYRGPRLSVLLDFELPILRPWLFATNAVHIERNRRIIHEILNLGHEKWLEVYAIEWAVARSVLEPALKVAGLAYSTERHPHRPIIMHYSSMVSAKIAEARWERIKARIDRSNRVELAFGTVGTGVFGNEPLLSPDALHRDLSYAAELGVRAVTIFRLGGLTHEHVTVLHAFAA